MVVRCLLSAVGVCALCLVQLHAADDEAASAGVSLFDTGIPSPQPLSPAALRAKQAWIRLPEDETAHRFRGDAVLVNGNLAAVLRANAAGFEVFSITAAGHKPRAALIPLAAGGSVPGTLASLKILENNPGAVMLEAAFQAGDGGQLSLQCQLSVGQSILEIRPVAVAARLRLRVASRYVVLPDFFGDDMVFTPDTLPRERIILPAENFFLTPLDGGEAMLMCVSSTKMQSTEAVIAGVGKQRSFTGYEVECAAGKSFWLALIDGPNVWHDQPFPDAELRAELALDWKPPFRAKWRADLVGPAGQARSWYFLGGPGSDEASPPVATAGCPCRFDGQRAVVDGPLAADAASGWPFPRPLLVYPMDRSRATPLTAFCPTDVLRSTLGVGPCQYILQTEGLQSDTNPTPDNVMTWIEKQIARKRHQKSADEIRDLLQQMTQHAGHVNERVQRYADLGRNVHEACARGQATASLRTAAATLEPIAQDLQRLATGPDVAAAPQRARQLAAHVVSLLDQSSPLAEAQRRGAELRSAGAAQDRALAGGRMTARWLHARAQMLADDDPAVVGWTQAVQALVEAALQDKR